MNKATTLETTAKYVQQKLGGATNGRDWWHVWRVWQMAKNIAAGEPSADLFTVELAALTHDLAHWQLTDGDERNGPHEVAGLLAGEDVPMKTIQHVQQIIRDTKFKGAGTLPRLETIEAKIIHDADKLESIGAIGIAKTFTYGGATQRPIYIPDISPSKHVSHEEYKHGDTTSVNHFYEKGLLLKDRMFTKKGKEIAAKRHKFLEDYLEEFYAEWRGER